MWAGPQFASLVEVAVRVLGGVHYRFAIRASEEMAPKAAAYTLKPAS
jgi:hypothetical protein